MRTVDSSDLSLVVSLSSRSAFINDNVTLCNHLARLSLNLSSLDLSSLLSFGIHHSADLSLVQPSSDLRSPSRLAFIRSQISLDLSLFLFNALISFDISLLTP
ncbi:unnamed protein product [Citrullus colocynthis]|uniref:Uncharacterized protein n=1 Tax=Citrullus colocynthis TaxID=252529 RepID=A0ABP0YK44_9ROSI